MLADVGIKVIHGAGNMANYAPLGSAEMDMATGVSKGIGPASSFYSDK